MKNLLFFLFIALLLYSNEGNGQTTQKLNFECGGYVTAVYPVKYPDEVPPYTEQLLYARTDVGGFYRSTNNGTTWEFKGYFNDLSSTIAMKKGDLQVLSVAVDPTNEAVVFVAAGDGPANADWDNCLYKTTNKGNNWTKVSTSNAKCAFMGNNFNIKTGGECLIFDPSTSGRMYMGGVPYASNMRGVFVSTNSGSSWSMLSGSNDIAGTDTVICITKHKDRANEIWVGTTSGVYRSTNSGANFTYWNNFRYTRRILLRSNGDAYIAWGLPADIVQNPDPPHLDNGLEKFTYSTSSWATLAWRFNTGGGFSYTQGNTTLAKTFFTTLSYYDNDESKIIAGRYGRPLRKTSDYGLNWYGNDYTGFANNYEKSQVLLVFNNPAVKPNHQFEQGYAYTGLNQFVQNPNANRNDYWYSSGGAALFKSENGGVNSTSKWDYSYSGMNMPVVFDISFQNYFYNNILIPIADWTNAYSTYTGARASYKLGYDNQVTRYNNLNSYIGLVSRALYSPVNNLAVSYLLGHDQYGYYNYKAIIAKRYQGGTAPVITKYAPTCDVFNNNYRSIVDGIIYQKSGETTNRIISLIGYSESKATPNEYSDIGIYSMIVNYDPTNVDIYCVPGDFSNQTEEDETQEKFNDALIPGHSKIDGTFNSQFNLANGPTLTDQGNSKVRNYLYLENAGFFISDDDGQTWSLKSNVISSGYLDEGTIKYSNDTIFIAMKNKGLYYAKEYKTYNTNNASYTFTAIGSFTSAEQIEHRYFPVNGRSLIYVFGKKSGDNDNKLYGSTAGAGGTYASISTTLPYIRSLRFNPDACKYHELWIGTSGQGVLVYAGAGYGIYSCANYVSESITINYNQDFANDVIVEDGATLTLDGNTSLKFSEGKKLIIEEGGELIIDEESNITFTTSDDGSTSWGGIVFQGTAKGYLKNCTFENTTTPITISPTLQEVPLFDTITIESCTFNEGFVEIDNRSNVILIGNTFDYENNGLEICGISSTGANNVLIKDNDINYSNSLTAATGINVIYGDNIVIYNNTIDETYIGMNISNSSPKIYWNTITNSDYNYTYTGIAMDNCVAPVLKENSINNYYNGLTTYLSSPVMYKNNIYCYTHGNYALTFDYNSIPRLEPIDLDTKPYWDAGENYINYEISGSAVYLARESYPLVKCAFNTIFGSDWNMVGTTDLTSYTIEAENNNWIENPATSGDFSLDCDISYSTYIERSPDYNNSPSYIDIGFAIEDTVQNSDESACQMDNSGGEGPLFAAAGGFENEGIYSSAKSKYEQIISEFRTGKYAKVALKRILHCVDKMNSGQNYSDLRNYYNGLASDTVFANIAAELATKCLVRQKLFPAAISEYEDVISSSQDSARIINSELNIIETYLIMISTQGDNSGYVGRMANLKPSSVKDALKKMHALMGRTKENDILTTTPDSYELSQNYPNPFNPVTKINYNLPKEGLVNLVIYDILGREIAKVVNNEFKQAGRYVVEFNGSNLASGVYFYRIIAANSEKIQSFVQTKKMVLIK